MTTSFAESPATGLRASKESQVQTAILQDNSQKKQLLQKKERKTWQKENEDGSKNPKDSPGKLPILGAIIWKRERNAKLSRTIKQI